MGILGGFRGAPGGSGQFLMNGYLGVDSWVHRLNTGYGSLPSSISFSSIPLCLPVRFIDFTFLSVLFIRASCR